MKLIARWARAFAHFWWDFLIGDTPELFVATMAIVVVALLIGRHHHAVAVIILPLMAVVFLVASAFRGRRRTATAEQGAAQDP